MMYNHGFTENTISWYRSFLTGRTQRVKIENCLSNSTNLVCGVPQGGILSPLLYIIYVADLMLWLKWSVIITYADDMSTSVSGKSLAEVISKLEEDALAVLKFMASNGLVANATKTTFVILGNKSSDANSIKIGQTEMKQEIEAKLLGMNFTDDLQWKTHTQKTISALNSRLYLIMRL